MKRNVDAAKRAATVTTLAYSLPGAFVGAACGLYGAYLGRWGVVVGIVAGFLVGFLVVFLGAMLLTEGAGLLARTVLQPSGGSTPAVREYSYPESLAARGHYEAAIDAYQTCCAEHPEDPEPCVRIARLYRDELANYEEALVWFKRARSESALTPAREQLIGQELIEIYTRKIGDPHKAIPELARLVDRFPDDPIARWAKDQIGSLRRELERDSSPGLPS